MADRTDSQLVGEVTKKFDEAKSHHDYFVSLYEKRERAYRGVKERLSDNRWRHNNRPPYAYDLLETVVASQIEMGLTYDVRPSPHAAMEPFEAQHALIMAEDVEHLLRHEYRVDQMDQKQRPVYLCDGIGGVGVLKTYWNYVPGARKRQGVQEKPIYGANGETIGTAPTIVEIEEQGIVRDHSTTEVVDPRDFVWHESARDLDPRKPGGAQHVFHRCWYSFEQLKWLEAMGFVSNIDGLKESHSFSGEYNDRETEVFNVNRTKDLIEVLEYWCFDDAQIKMCWVANRTQVIRPLGPSPFWHDQYPFAIVSSMPQPFSLHGTSTIELIEDLQSILWELGNQRLDNIELINNAIYLIRSDVEDPDAWEHYPGARWEVESTDQVEPLIPPYQVAQVSIESESLLKGDFQNITGAAPFAGGTQTATVDQKTATGASIVMNAAQQRLAQKKYQAQFGFVREANLRLRNCQQFLDGNRLVHILGPEGGIAFKSIPIVAIQADYLVELRPMGESEVRQERRAEANNFFQMLLGAAPLMAASGNPLDLKQAIKWYAEQWNIDYPDQFFSQSPAAMGAMAGLGGQGSGAPGQQPGGAPGAAAPPGGGPNFGTTAATAVDAASPSATGGLSMSPQFFLQRALAQSRSGQGGAAQ